MISAQDFHDDHQQMEAAESIPSTLSLEAVPFFITMGCRWAPAVLFGEALADACRLDECAA